MNRVFKLCLAGSVVLALFGLPALSSGPATAGAQACRSGTPPPADPYPGTTVAAANFEAGTLEGFRPAMAGTGRVAVSSETSRSANCSAVLRATADPGSIANMTLSLPPGMTEAFVDGWFNIAGEGMAGNNVPYFRFFSGGVRVLDVFRQNVTRELVLRTASPQGNIYTTLTSNVPISTWHRLVMHVVPNGPETAVQIWWDGRSVYAGSSESIRSAPADTVQLGSEHDQQMGDIYIDDVIINTSAGTPAPIPGPLPVPPPDPVKRLDDVAGDWQTDLLAGDSWGPATSRRPGTVH
ncbi:hypothetical protein [Arthrobacter oryzae]|nr:hypothetical protein [Arthrobacter oryzae]